MLAQRFAIEIDIRDRTGGLEADEITLAGYRFAQVQLAPIPARAAMILLPLLRRFSAPTVRDGQRLPVVVVKIIILGTLGLAVFEMPAVIQPRVFAGKTGKRGGRQTQRDNDQAENIFHG